MPAFAVGRLLCAARVVFEKRGWCLAAGARRLHDTGRSGWWQLLYLIPIIGFIVVIIFLAQDSQEGDNDWGAKLIIYNQNYRTIYIHIQQNSITRSILEMSVLHIL